VPHAFTPEYPADERSSRPCKVPVILNVYDGYMFGANTHDLAIDVEDAFQNICEMSYCHQSQIVEWLPWVGRHRMEAPKSLSEWSETLRKRFERKGRELGLSISRALEVFTVTAWGAVPDYAQLLNELPGVLPDASHLDALRAKLHLWNVE